MFNQLQKVGFWFEKYVLCIAKSVFEVKIKDWVALFQTYTKRNVDNGTQDAKTAFTDVCKTLQTGLLPKQLIDYPPVNRVIKYMDQAWEECSVDFNEAYTD